MASRAPQNDPKTRARLDAYALLENAFWEFWGPLCGDPADARESAERDRESASPAEKPAIRSKLPPG